MLGAIWILVAIGLTLWSALGWGLYQLLRLDHAWLGDLKPLLEQVPWGAWLEQWVPGWQAMTELAIDAVQLALGSLGTAAPVVVWVVWGVGTMLIVGAGALLSLSVVLLRDRAGAKA